MQWRTDTRLRDAGRQTNEDAAGVAGPLAFVLDGAGLGASPRFAGFATDAAWLVAEATDWLTRRADDQGLGARGLASVLEDLQAHLTAAYGAPDSTDPSGGPSACLMLARLDPGSPRTLDLAWIADCVALVPVASGDIEVFSDDRVAAFESLIFEAMAREPGQAGALSPAARAQIRQNRNHLNQPKGYAAISPTRPWQHLVCHHRMAFDATRPLVLLSDGASRLYDLFDGRTARDVYDVAARGDGAALLADLRGIERADGECLRYPRFKVHDDATILVVSSEPH
jgi:hypothetical protein